MVYKFLSNSTLSPVKYWIQINAGSKGLQKELNPPSTFLDPPLGSPETKTGTVMSY